jgi:hypothetical protein
MRFTIRDLLRLTFVAALIAAATGAFARLLEFITIPRAY